MMTLAGAESLMRMLGFLVVMFPVAIVLAVVATQRITRRNMMTWIHVYAAKELRHKFVLQKAAIKWRDRKLERLEARQGEILAAVRGGLRLNVRVQEALAGIAEVYDE